MISESHPDILRIADKTFFLRFFPPPNVVSELGEQTKYNHGVVLVMTLMFLFKIFWKDLMWRDAGFHILSLEIIA